MDGYSRPRSKFTSSPPLVLLLLFVCSYAVAFAQSGAPRFHFALGEPLAVTWEQLSEGAVVVEVLNDAAREITLSAQLSGFTFQDSEGNPRKNSEVIILGQHPPRQDGALGVITLPKAGSAQIKVSLADPGIKLKPADGSDKYSGFISVYEEASSAVIHKPFEITLDASHTGVERKVAPLPLVGDLAITNYRLVPLTTWWFCFDCELPLQGKVSDDNRGLPAGKTLGGVQREQGGTAAIVSDRIETSPGSPPRMRLNVEDMYFAGKYKGQINLGSAAKPANVNLTVNAKDLVIWPVLVLGFGIWLALKAKQYLNVRRNLLALRAQEAAIGERYVENQAKFIAAAQGSSYSSYSIGDDLDAERKAIIKKLDDFEKLNHITLDTNDPKYKSITETLKTLEAQVEAWPGFAHKLGALAAALEKARATASVSPIASWSSTESKQPLLFESCAPLLVGGELKTSGLQELSNQVVKAKDFVAQWTELATRIEKAWALLNRIEGRVKEDEPAKKRLVMAERKIREAGHELWKIRNDDELLERATKADLNEAESILASVSGVLDEPVESARGTNLRDSNTFDSAQSYGLQGTYGTYPVRDMINDYRGLDDAGRRRAYEKEMGGRDKMIARLAFVIAILTGLNSYYFNKPFGTLGDYATMLLLGLGTRAALDVINAGIEKYFQRL